MTEQENVKPLTQEEQEANAYLRERFLYFISSLCSRKKECQINMYENTQVSGIIKAVDLNFEHITIANLKTPLPVPLKMAVLRTCDVLTVSYT